MDETDDVVSVTRISESTVSVGGSTVDETLIQTFGVEGKIEASLDGEEVDGEDGEEIMVEVVGSDVLFDGVCGPGGAVKEKEMESVDDKGGGNDDLGSGEVEGLGIEERNGGNGSGSEGEQTRVDVVEEAAVVGTEAGSDIVEELVVDGKGDGGGVVSSSKDEVSEEAPASEIETKGGDSLVDVGSLQELTQVVTENGVDHRDVVPGTDVGGDTSSSKEGVLEGEAQASEDDTTGGDSSVIPESLQELTQVVSETAMQGSMESVDGVAVGLDDLTSETIGLLDEKVQNPGAVSGVVCSSPIAESSIVHAQVVVDETVTEEVLSRSDEGPGAEVVEVKLQCSEVDQSSEIETICKNRNGDIHTNDELPSQQANVAFVGEVGMMNTEEILHSEAEVRGIHSGEDQQMKVETAGGSTEQLCDLSGDLLSSSEHCKLVSHSEVATVDDNCSLGCNVEAPKAVGSSGTGGDIGEVGVIHADSGSSMKQSQVTGASIEISDNAEELTLGGYSRSDTAVCFESEISSKGVQLVQGNEVAEMQVDVLVTKDIEGTDHVEADQDKKYEATCGSAGKDGAAHEEMDTEEEFDLKDELSGIDALDTRCSGKDQCMKVEKIVGCSVNDVGLGDLESCGDLNLIAVRGDTDMLEHKEVLKREDKAKEEDVEALCNMPKIDCSIGNSCLSEAVQDLEAGTFLRSKKGEDFLHADQATCEGEDAAVMEGEKVSNSKVEGLIDDTGSLQKDEKLNELTGVGSTEMDSAAQEFSESFRMAEIEMEVESSVMDCVQVSSCHASDENTPSLEKMDELKVERMHGSKEDIVAGKDPSVGDNPPLVGNLGASIPGTNSDSIEVNTFMQDEKQETVPQIAATHTQEVDGVQNINPSTVGEISNQGPTGVVLSDTIVEDTVGSQAALSCASFHGEDFPVSSYDSDLVVPIPDVNQNLAGHLVSNDISLSDGDQIIETCVPHVVTSNDVVNQTIEAKDGSCEADDNHPLCAHAAEAEESNLDDKPIVGSQVGDLDTCLNKDRVWKSQDNTAEENNYMPDESCMGDGATGSEGNVELNVSESLHGSADICCTVSNAEQKVEVEELYSDAEKVDLHIRQQLEIREQATNTELSKDTDEIIFEQATPEPENFVSSHQARYMLPSENEGEYSVSDLVWGKVRSHPWWPGQIFYPADASEKAMKYYRKDCFLVAYFGDRTFAWNDASLLKPFWTPFSQIEKQSNAEAFQNAVSCALEEVSRRVELGLACSCISEDAYEKIESQIVENTGIRQELSRRYGLDKSLGANAFEPGKLVEFIKALACSPSGGADRLELVIVKAQLLAFSRLKGYNELPEIQFCGALLENDTDASQSSEVIEHATPVSEDDEQIKGKPKNESNSSNKRKHNLKDSVYPYKKEKSLSEINCDMAYSPDGDVSNKKGTSQSVPPSSGIKRKAVDSTSDGSVLQDRRVSFYAAKVSRTASPIPKPSFKIGECISRVASQLTGSPSVLKCSSSDRQEGFDSSLLENSQKGAPIVPAEHSSLDEILSQLHLAAQDPMKGYSFINTITCFFSGFRNSIVLGQYSGKQNSSMGKMGGGRKKKASHAITGSPEEFEFDDVNDSYWTDMIVQNNPEEEPSGISQNPGEYQLVPFEPDKSIKRNRRSYSRKRYSNGHHEMPVDEPIAIDKRKQDLSPTELLLNFTEGDPVPSEMSLNKMFRRFGALRESETEVDNMTSRARVVFKRCSDAEVAFSSAGKFNIFGPMLVNYQLNYSPSQLNYSPSISFKTLPLATIEDQDYAM